MRQQLVRSELAVQCGFIHVDADRMRERIPIGESKPTSEQTQTDDAARRIQSLQDKGYKVELLAVATPREESLLGIYQRHEQQHATGASNPRFVPESYHEEALSGFDATVAKTTAQLDRVRVVNRAGERLYDSAAPHSNSQANALEAMAAARKLTDAKLAKLNETWAVVEARAEARGAPAAYLEAVARQRQQAQEMKNGRIHAHAMSQLDANAATLARDSRYTRHTDGELV